jgi:arabinofuranosyltransferase
MRNLTKMPPRPSDQYVAEESSQIYKLTTLTRIDALICLTLLAATAIWITQHFHASYVPIEDAAMLLRYAKNLSQGFGMRWNIHQAPVDGATDFFFTVAIASLARLLHIGVIPASRILNIAAHTISVQLVFVGGRILGGNRWVAAAIAVYLMIGPALQYTLGCFGAPFFAVLLMCCWLAGLNYAIRGASWFAALTMALLALLAGLTRPEGVLISLFFLAATLYLTPRGSHTSGWTPLLTSYVAVFGLLGGAYFAWHWRYFGYPLPNPYYVKGNGHLYPSSVSQAVANICNLLGPVLPLLPLGWLLPRTRRLTIALAGVIVAFTLMWILLNDWNNAYMRFQYAIIPAVLVTVPTLAGSIASFLQRQRQTTAQRIAVAIACLLFVFFSALYARRAFPPMDDIASGMRAFATTLRPFADKGYTIVVTEAGTLPFYSEWQTIDGLGLNDRYMAHNGHRLTTEYLDSFHPEVLMVHIDNGPPAWQYRQELYGDQPSDGSSWGNMGFINGYARDHGYTLAAAWGANACNLHMYWIRPGFPDYDRILSLLRQHPYRFLDNGQVSSDYRDHMQDLRDCEHP